MHPAAMNAFGRRTTRRSRERAQRLRRVASMPPQPGVGPIEAFMIEDHVDIDRLLARADEDPSTIDEPTYDAFRRRLLKHIAMEERVLIPYARDKRGGEPLEIAARLREDHGMIAKLLVRSPTPALLAALRALIARHNPLEEGEEGLYAQCDRLAGDEVSVVVERLRAQKEVPAAKYYDGPIGMH